MTITATGSNLSQLYSMAKAAELPLDQYPKVFVEPDSHGNIRLRPLEEVTAPNSGVFPDDEKLKGALTQSLKQRGYEVAIFEDARDRGAMGDGTASGPVHKIETPADYTRLAEGKLN